MPTPRSPYYAVIFSSQRTARDDGYSEMAQRMEELGSQQPGFLGIDSVRDANGRGITVSYWSDLESIRAWRDVAEHKVAQAKGRSVWYESYEIRICRVEAESAFRTSGDGAP